VISAGVIKHYKKQHPERLPEMKLELCQARLDKISDGNMVLVGDKETLMDGLCDIECQICHLTYPMIPAFNICRAIRHIKIKHPEVMPEHKGGESTRDNFPTEEEQLELEAAEREQQERKQQEQEQQQHQQEQEGEEEVPGTSASTSTLQNGPNIGAASGSGICIKALHCKS
jgi:Na+-translocating ferredoxin:NAD+ oxidoreductase RnfC subunit